ncbi:MAG: hypothetical protein B6U69_00775 [Thermofilum sp. ex4484_15]|nr:MAG: hypothetical protein B6U69_00775 [Thermofilum sp. ex4484_15]
MVKNPLRNLLNRLLWDKEVNKGDYEIVYVSRGSRGGLERINCNYLKGVTRDFFIYIKGEEEKYIPLHRVVEVIKKSEGRKVYHNPRFK